MIFFCSSNCLITAREYPGVEISPREPQYVHIDQQVYLNCRITSGIPTPQVTWRRTDGRPLPTNARIEYSSLM